MRRIALRAVLALSLAAPGGAGAVDVPKGVRPPDEQPVQFRADRMERDSDLGTVTARGNVEAVQGDRVLRADLVTFNDRTGVVSASGNVVILEPSGEVLFAEYVELRDSFRNGVLTSLRVLFKDDSRLAANSATREDGNRTLMKEGVYTGCQVCAEDPKAEPLWQFRAKEVVHDEQQREIRFYDATFEVFGTPIAYLPYWSVPDPTVKRESGILFPDLGSSGNLGLTAKLPVYIVTSPSSDLTLAPIVTTKEGAILTAEYRQRTERGRFEFDTSITPSQKPDSTGARTGDKDLRGHIRGTGRFSIDETWRWGFDVFRATDDTYLKYYKFSSLDTLTTNTFVEGIKGRGYAAANAYSFQGLLSTDQSGLSPVVLPLLEHYIATDPNGWGGYFSADSSILAVHRTEGVDTRRASTILGYTNPVVTDGGHLLTFTAQMRADGYWIDEGTDPTGGGRVTGNSLGSRTKPLAAVEWRFPLVGPLGTAQAVVEPIVSGVITPYGGNPANITNEDSRNFEFDDTNLFAINRFPGRDRYEGGPRVNYGARAAVHGLSGGFSEILLGQSWRIDPDNSIPTDTGLDKEFSDYVGRIVVAPSPLFDITHRFRLSQGSLDVRRNEVTAGFGPSWARFRVGYLDLRRDDPTLVFGNREEISATALVQMTKNVSVYGGIRYDIEREAFVSGVVGLRYLDECFSFAVELDRVNIRDRDIEPDTSIKVRFRLLNLN